MPFSISAIPRRLVAYRVIVGFTTLALGSMLWRLIAHPALMHTQWVLLPLALLAANVKIGVAPGLNVRASGLVICFALVLGAQHSDFFTPIFVAILVNVNIEGLRKGRSYFLVNSLLMSYCTVFTAVLAAALPQTIGIWITVLVPLVWMALNILAISIDNVLEEDVGFSVVFNGAQEWLTPMIVLVIVGAVTGQLTRSLGYLTLPLLLIPASLLMTLIGGISVMRDSYDLTLNLFLQAIHVKDEYTGRHSNRVAKYAIYAGEELGYSKKRLENLYRAALLHDVGKIATPLHLLNKPGRLTAEEFEVVKQHNRVCIDILWHVNFLRPVIEVAADKYGHFETDKNSENENQHMDSYIVAVADAFDAMTSTRPYRQALPMETAFQELRDKSGKQFNPHAADALIRAIEKRNEQYGEGFEEDAVDFGFEVPQGELGSAGLGNLAESESHAVQSRFGVTSNTNNILAFPQRTENSDE